ncbi:hypothetical protein WS67_22760 [Burkholderia singularis]|uniref:Fatty acid desaturase domain-containing protein n=2 Tax=Burkholderia singularis TaxID=1503053 RepID=A0A103DVJ0_9BURK|nr:hypothetical protein WS67_22760 [Burkholderia singularis]
MGTLYLKGQSEQEDNLEGDVDVKLAPVSGADNRRQLPRQLFERKPLIFVAKFTLAITLIGVGWLAIGYQLPWPVIVVAMLINGLMYAHLVELQHECLHGHAFRSSGLNRLFGVLCGIFMMSSHSHYRYDHLRHHAYLGTATNSEHFDYRFQNLDSWLGFARSFFDLSRYRRLARLSWLSLAWRPLPNIDKRKYNRDIKQEYLLNLAVLVASIGYTIQSGSMLVALAWWIPTLLVAEGVHFMIEMPEHFGLNTQTDPNVLTNTRTIHTSKFFTWFVNGNDLHTAHHYHHGVPMCNIHQLNDLIEPYTTTIESSYLSFYRRVINGNICQSIDTSSMKR